MEPLGCLGFEIFENRPSAGQVAMITFCVNLLFVSPPLTRVYCTSFVFLAITLCKPRLHSQRCPC